MLQSIMDFDLRSVKELGLTSDDLMVVHWWEKERALGATSVMRDGLVWTSIDPPLLLRELSMLATPPEEIIAHLDDAKVLQIRREEDTEDSRIKRVFARADWGYQVLVEREAGR